MPIPKQTFAVLNSSGHIISGPGITLQPGLNEGVSVAAFNKAFLGADGQPTLSAAKHLIPSGDKRPALLPISLKTVLQLPQDFALQAISGARQEDEGALLALLAVEPRKPVADAIRARLKATAALAPPRAPEPHAPSPEAKAPKATPEEAQAMLIPISHPSEATPPEPTGLVFSGARESVPEVTGLPGHLGAGWSKDGAGISATGTDAPASKLQQVLTNYGEASAVAGNARTVAETPATGLVIATAEVAPESPPASAPALTEQAPAATPPQPVRRSRRGGQA